MLNLITPMRDMLEIKEVYEIVVLSIEFSTGVV